MGVEGAVPLWLCARCGRARCVIGCALLLTDVMAEAVIFDLDGTLLDSLADIAAACNHALEQLGYERVNEARFASIAGVGTRPLLSRLLRDARGGVDAEASLLESAVKLKLSFEDENDHKLTKPFKGVEAMLHELQNARVPMAILSNKTQDVVRRVTARFFSRISFRHIGGAVVDTPLKPDATAALRIARECFDNVEPSRCLFVGDTDVDMRTAINAGMTPVAVSWGFRPAQQLVRTGASTVVSEASQIVQLVSGVYKHL